MESIQLGLIVSPALDAPVAEELREEVRRVLSERYPSVGWELEVARDPLVKPPVNLTELVEATRERMLAEGWDLAVLVTDVPLGLEAACLRALAKSPADRQSARHRGAAFDSRR